MEAVFSNTQSKAYATKTQNIFSKMFHLQVDSFDKNRLGYMALYLTAQSCLGSIACMFVLKNGGGDLPLIASAAITMWANAMFIAQASSKWSMIIFDISILINLAIIIAFSF